MARFVPWMLVALCFVLGVASRSLGDSFPVFVPALERAFAASRGDVTIIYSFALLVGGISGPVNGWILDRLGLRALTVIGMSLAAAALFAASQATALWHLYATIGVMLGFGGAAVSGVLSAGLLGRWFPARRLGVALAVAWSATGVGTMVTIPVAQAIIVESGWRHAYLVFSIVSVVFVPLVLVLPWRRIAAGAHAARAWAVAGILTPLGMVGFSWLADRGGRKLAAILAYGC